MELPHASVLQDRHIGTDEEAGTSPGDRLFRPDVEGLRAVAVVLVVLYHAHVPALAGGYVGVDVFFVISGFVITGLLIRERDSTGTSSLINFYARRVRRILPEATLVLLATVTASYLLLGYVSGDSVANDGRWAAVFLSNVHFERTGTNYLSSILPPSPLQNYWSLSVEEQFYIVFPTIVALTALARRAGSRFRAHRRLSRCHRGLVQLVGRANELKSHCGVLLATDPLLGTGPRRPCGRCVARTPRHEPTSVDTHCLVRYGRHRVLGFCLQWTDTITPGQ